jgi:hypothetical protein
MFRRDRRGIWLESDKSNQMPVPVVRSAVGTTFYSPNLSRIVSHATGGLPRDAITSVL